MMLKKVVLIAGGNKGLELKFDGYRKISDTHMANYEDNRKDRLPVPLNIRRKFNNLRYFFMTMVGVWPEELTVCLDDYYSKLKTVDDLEREGVDVDGAAEKLMRADTLLQKCTIQGYEIRGNEIRIIGTFENIEGKPYKPSLPFINEDDDYEFFQEAKTVIQEISNMVVHYMKEENIELAEMRKILLELQQSNPTDVERINKQTDEENYIELMNRFEGQAIVIPLEGSDLEKALESFEPKAKVVSSKTVDKSKFVEAETVKPKEKKSFRTMTFDEIKEEFPIKEGEAFVDEDHDMPIASSFFDEDEELNFNATEKEV